MPRDFDDFLWNSRFNNLQLRCPTVIVTECYLLIRKVPKRRIKIGKGWKIFCRVNGLVNGDEVLFEFVPGNRNVVNVRKC